MERQMIHGTRVLIGVGTLFGAVMVLSVTGARAADGSNGWYTPVAREQSGIGPGGQAVDYHGLHIQKNGFPSGSTPLGAQEEGRMLVTASGSQAASNTTPPLR